MKRFSLILVALVCAFFLQAQPKYVFYFIGDGMGQNQVLLSEMYLAQLDGEIGRKQLCMTQFPYAGLASSFSASNSITDSSAAGTCLATGKKTKNGRLGIDAKGEQIQSIADILHDKHWAVGLATSVSIDHATPAAFYANVFSRNDYYEIGVQLAETGFEFFGGSTFYKPFLEEKPKAENVYDLCRKNGYLFCRGYKDFCNQAFDSEKVILIQEHEGLTNDYKGTGKIPYTIDRKEGDLTLAEITRAGIDFLYKKDKPFFYMVEGGQIDWACHGNDAAAVIQETIDFDQAIQVAFNFYRQHPDETLIVVTADHETGGMALGNSDYTLHLDLLQYQTASAGEISGRLSDLHKQFGKKLTFDHVKKLFAETLGLFDKVEVSAAEEQALLATYKLMMKNKTKDSKNMYASINALADQAMRLLDAKAHVGWTTHSHSASAVPVFAVGVGAENFTGFYDNSDIMPRMLKVALGE